MRAMLSVGVFLLVACGPGKTTSTPIGGEQTVAPVLDAGEVAGALRLAELHADGTALISAEGPPLDVGKRLVVAALEPFDGTATALPVVTVEIGARITEFLDHDATQLFLVCGDSRGGDAPPLYRAKVVVGSVEEVAGSMAAVAWPAELGLTYEPGIKLPTDPPGEESELARTPGILRVDVEHEPIQLDDDPALETLELQIGFLAATAECRFPYLKMFRAADDDSTAIAVEVDDAPSCFSQLPMFHEMACCSEPACSPGDPRALCAWPPPVHAPFEPDLSPASFSQRPFIGNVLGPVRGAVHGGGAAVWIRGRQSFEGEGFRFEYGGPVEAGGVRHLLGVDTYVYHCAY